MVSQSCQKVSRFSLIGLTLVGWIFSILTVSLCSFVAYRIYYDLTVYDGIFSFKLEGDSCEKYSSEGGAPTYMKAARAFGVLLTLSLSAAMILAAIAVLIHPNRIIWIVYRVLLGLCFAFNTGTFAMFGECVEIESIQCSVGGAGVFAILNAFILVATFVLACITPVPDEAVFKIGGAGASASSDMASTDDDTPVATIKRTVEETPEGNTITEEVTDESGVTTITTTFEPSSSSKKAQDFLKVGPTVKTTIMELPNGTKTVEEDAQGNKTVTTRIIMEADEEEEAYSRAVPVSSKESNVVMTAATVAPEVGSKQSIQNEVYGHDYTHEEPYGGKQAREHGYSSPYSQGREFAQASNSGMSSTRNQPISHNTYDMSDSGLDKPGKPTPRDLSSSFKDPIGSADQGTFISGTSTSGSRSSNFDASYAYAPGVDSEQKRTRKQKTKKHAHHRREHGHSSSSHRKREIETVE